METYKIIRFYRDNWEQNRTIKRGLTLAQAQAHCRRPETRGESALGPWFDGYDIEQGGSS